MNCSFSTPDIHDDSVQVKFDLYDQNGYGISVTFFYKNNSCGRVFEELRKKLTFKLWNFLETEDVQHAVPSMKLSLDKDIDQQLKNETLMNQGS